MTVEELKSTPSPEIGPKSESTTLAKSRVADIISAQGELLSWICGSIARCWREQQRNSEQSPKGPLAVGSERQPQDPPDYNFRHGRNACDSGSDA